MPHLLNQQVEQRGSGQGLWGLTLDGGSVLFLPISLGEARFVPTGHGVFVGRVFPPPEASAPDPAALAHWGAAWAVPFASYHLEAKSRMWGVLHPWASLLSHRQGLTLNPRAVPP